MTARWRVSLRPPRGRDKNYLLRVFDPDGKEVKTRSTRTNDPAEAERLRVQVEQDFNGRALSSSDPTLGEVWAAYEEFRRTRGAKPATLNWISSSRKAMPGLLICHMSEIILSVLQREQDHLLTQHSPRTVRHYLACMALMWRWARKRGYTTSVFPDLDSIEVPRTNKRPFAPAEVASLFKSALEYAGGRYYSALRFLHETGCRVSEACGVHERDVDRSTGAVRFARTKTGKERTVFVSPEVLALLPVRQPDELVFTAARGGPLPRESVHNAFVAIARMAGLEGEPVDVHSFRRTWVQDATSIADLPHAVAMKGSGHETLSVFSAYQANSITRDAKVAFEAVRAYRASQETPSARESESHKSLADKAGNEAQLISRIGPEVVVTACYEQEIRTGDSQGPSAVQGSAPVSSGEVVRVLAEVAAQGQVFRDALRALCLDEGLRSAVLRVL